MVEGSESAEGRATSPEANAPNGENSRLLITKLVMENFKSYGGVREIGPFHKCFSSIVGPNGSGKSNVIDAMLFVFGKKAKKLRLNKVSELIHRSEAFPDLDFTRVSVHFVDIVDDAVSEDAYEEVAGTQLVVTRTAFSNNSSKYHVDGKPATFADVGALLRRRGVDLDNNRFLILQGEVEQIAMMKPRAANPQEEGLLEYLEDIIGSNRHVEATEAASQEVESREEDRNEKLARLKLAEREKEGLEGAKLEVEALLRTEAAIRRRRNELLQASAAAAEADAAKAVAAAAGRRTALVEQSDALKAAEVRQKEAQKQFDKAEAEHGDVRNQLERAKASFADLERRDIKLAEDKKFLDTQRRKLQGAVEGSTKKRTECETHAQELEASAPTLKRAVSQAARRKADEEAALEAVNADLRERTKDLRAELEAAQASAAPVRAECDAIKNRLETAKCEMLLVEAPVVEAKRGLEKAEAARHAAAAEAESNARALAAAEAESAALEGEMASAATALKAATKAEESAAAAATRALAAAEEAKAAREALAGRSGALKTLLAAAKPGGPLADVGIHGRLGDLGSIDDAYDVAISTACGFLDHIVVDSAEGGARCVEYLRAQEAGRASFIILQQLGHLSGAMSRPYQGRNGCPRLFDLVRPAQQAYRPAFYLAVRDTLVAQDLDAAVAVAYDHGRCVARVVTRDGQLIDQSGAMSGGGGAARRGGMGSSASAASASAAGAAMTEKDAAAASEAAVAAEARLREARTEKRSCEDRVRALRRRGEELCLVVPKLKLEVAGAADADMQLAERAERLRKHCEMSKEAKLQVKKLGGVVREEEAALKRCAEELANAEAAVSALQAAILDAGGERLRRAAKQTAAAAAALSAAEEEATAATTDALAERKKAEKAAKEVEKRKKELHDVETKLVELAKAVADTEEKAEAVVLSCQKLQAEAETRRAGMEALAAELETGRAELKKLRSDMADGNNSLEELTRKAKESTALAARWREELVKLRAVHASEFAEWGLPDDELEEDEHDSDEEAEESGVGDEGGVEESKCEEGKRTSDGGQSSSNRKEAAVAPAAPGASNVHNGVLPELDTNALASVDRKALQRDIAALEGEREKLKSNVNMSALLEYRKKDIEYLKRAKDLEDATMRRNAARVAHEELRRRRLDEFMAGFGTITLKLKEMYQMITLGGDAELELVDSLDPFSEGVVFSVRPPKKSWKNIANLSGGEKTLSSLALVFALHHYKPTPLYVMDEIDAALDFKNVSIVANYIKERTKNAQFIIISLRNNMFELADRLVGIYKTQNVTKSVTINPKKFAGVLEGSGSGARVLTDKTNAIVEAA